MSELPATRLPDAGPPLVGSIEHALVTDQMFQEAVDRVQLLPEEQCAHEAAIIDEAVATLGSLTLNRQRQEALALTGEIVKWTMHAEPGGRLPTGLIYVMPWEEALREPTGQPEVIGDEQYFGSPGAFTTMVEDVVKAAALPPRYEMAFNAMLDPASELHQLVLKHPALEFLRHFDMKPQTQDRPLTSAERMREEQKIDAEVRLKHGLALGATVVNGTPVNYELVRRKSWLDEQRLPNGSTVMTQASQRKPGQAAGVAAFRARYLPDAREKLREKGYNPDAIDNTFDTTISRLDTTKYPEPYIFIFAANSIFEDIADTIMRQFSSGSEKIDKIVYSIVQDTIQSNLFPGLFRDRPGTTMSEAIRQTCDVEKDYLAESFRSLAWRDTFRWHELADKMRATGRLKQRAMNPNVSIHESSIREFESYNAGSRKLLSEEDMLEAGTAYQLSGRAGAAGRIIATTSQSISKLPFSDQPRDTYDLVIDDLINRSQAPVVPGFKTVARLGGGFAVVGLVRAEHDPYAPCEVPVPAENIPALIEWFAGLGAEAIVDRLQAHDSLTVAQLERLIADSSDYHVPLGGDKPQDAGYLSDHEKPKPHLKNGRLQLQCVEAADILHKCLCIGFGRASSTALTGNYITATGDGTYAASELGHVQVMFAHNGRQYILDSTPSVTSDDAARLERAGHGLGGSNAGLQAVQAMGVNHPGHSEEFSDILTFAGQADGFDAQALLEDIAKREQPTEDTPDMYEPVSDARPVEESLRKDPMELREQLERQLIEVFGVRTRQELYRNLPRPRSHNSHRPMPQRDPVLRTVALLATSAAGGIDEAHLTRTIRYIGNYPKLQQRLSARGGLRAYDDLVLRLLTTALQQL